MTSNRFENNQAEPTRAAEPRRVTPAVDIFENAAGFVILADLPGVETNELSVEFNPPELRVSARPQNAPFVYERRFELGSGVDAASTSAELKDGVLTVTLPKKAEARARKIAVKSG